LGFVGRTRRVLAIFGEVSVDLILNILVKGNGCELGSKGNVLSDMLNGEVCVHVNFGNL
jgi:hypothetical protein